MNQFKLGEKVEWMIPGITWEQRAHYPRYYHSGTITRVIHAGDFYTNDSYDPRSRDHESYEVTEQIGKRKPKAYWPQVNRLRTVV